MQSAGQPEDDAADREAETSASRLAPLTIVSGAVAGDDLDQVAAGASDALGRPVAIALPEMGKHATARTLREAELLLELGLNSGQDATYRLLIGVLMRDPQDLEQLHARTIAPLAAYDAEHDTDLVATLDAFLAHNGSTTETAEAMSLHRHTVGYRLSRIQEVSGLSPYESDGRERLGLGLKADQILTAASRRRT